MKICERYVFNEMFFFFFKINLTEDWVQLLGNDCFCFSFRVTIVTDCLLACFTL